MSTFLLRLSLCFLVMLLAILATQDQHSGNIFFCTVTGFLGAAGFLLIRPSVSIPERIRMIGTWDMAMPLVLIGYMTLNNLGSLEERTLWLVFAEIFSVGMSMAARLIFRGPDVR